VFSELSVCGYPSRDFLEFEDYINKCKEAIDEIAQHTTNIAAIVGAPQRNPRAEGKDLFNSAWFLYQGTVQHITHKTLLPTYDIFDEVRYFQSNTAFELVEYKGKKLSITICEDIWNVATANHSISPVRWMN
jgi:NAD+ synthase (glutamine-hydrolysing)